MNDQYFASRPSSPSWETPRNISTATTEEESSKGNDLTRAVALSKASSILTQLCGEDDSSESVQDFINSWKYQHGPRKKTLQPNVLEWFNSSQALIMAVQKRNLEAVHLLLAHGVKSNERAVSLAAIATREGHDKTMLKLLLEQLLETGWDINTPTSLLSPSVVADLLHDEALVAWCLSRGADPNATSQANKTLLHHAAHNGSLESVRLLVEAGATFTHPSPSEDVIACAVSSHDSSLVNKDRRPVISYLIQQGANMDAYYLASRRIPTGLEGILGQSTALHLAIMDGKQDIVELLVKAGADTEMKTTNLYTGGKSVNANEFAVIMGRSIVVDFLAEE